MSASNPPESPPAQEPWYVTAFQDDYRAVYSHRDVPSARREVAWVAAGPLAGVDGRVLDLCCGFGRHSLALSERGFRVFGMDLSFDLLRAARDLPDGPARLGGRLARGDMSRLPYRAGAFSAVVNLFTSFGYLGDELDARVLDEVARVLAPGGVLVMDLMNPASVRAGLVPRSREERDGAVLEGVRALADGGRRITKEVRLRLANGVERTWREDVRMYEPAELDALLAARGLEVSGRNGDLAGGAFGPEALRQVVTARRSL
ncbi:MAG: class I SAM-dependent methyltransferase [Planctomycetota bacterium]